MSDTELLKWKGAYLRDTAKLTEKLERLQAALKECADGLANELGYRYLNTLNYPSQRARYEQDMAPVYEARRMLGSEQEAPR